MSRTRYPSANQTRHFNFSHHIFMRKANLGPFTWRRLTITSNPSSYNQIVGCVNTGIVCGKP